MSLQRIERFLLASEIEIPSRDNRSAIGIDLQNGHFFWNEVETWKPSHQQVEKDRVEEEKQFKQKNRAAVKPETPQDSAEQSQPFELTGINVSFESNQLSAIVGHVGCGKSSLLNAILGEMPRFDQSTDLNSMVHIKGSIGYVPQTPFIMNASLRDNILFGSPFNEEKYKVRPIRSNQQ